MRSRTTRFATNFFFFLLRKLNAPPFCRFQDEFDINEAESREEKRWMERQNEKERKKKKNQESARILKLVETAEKLDPRVKSRREEERNEKNKKKEEEKKKRMEEVRKKFRARGSL